MRKSGGLLQHRRSTRLSEYDYSAPGAYFVTICTNNLEESLGGIHNEQVILSDVGFVAAEEWLLTIAKRSYLQSDEYVVMPNHFHAIINLIHHGCRGTARPAHARSANTSLPRKFGFPVAGSVPTIVGAFKAAVSKRINEIRDTPGYSTWQRGYYEHVIRSTNQLRKIGEYIKNNPLKWSVDKYHVSQSGTARRAPTGTEIE